MNATTRTAAWLLIAAGVAVARARGAEDAASAYAFFGGHQAGITTPVQEHLHFASFDMMARTDRADLIELLQDWSYAAARLTQGLEVSATGAVGGSPEAPPDDTGEACISRAHGSARNETETRMEGRDRRVGGPYR